MKTQYTAQDIGFMQEALKLAKGGEYTAHPNPCVGAVIVRDGKIVGKGFHSYFGGDHAEVMALKEAGEQAFGATCYITLEPCSHHGKTPPCVDALVAAGIKKVILAAEDPNPRVNGRGIQQLKEKGVDVSGGLLALEAKMLNPAFHYAMEKRRPYVVVKSAMSFDGRTAMNDGTSQWITGEESRNTVQKLRACADAIVTGIETVLKDDPAMTVRSDTFTKLSHFRQPKRVVLDSRLRIPENAKILKNAHEVIIATTSDNQEKIKRLQTQGITIWLFKGDRVDLHELMQRLIQTECQTVLVEAGATLNGAFWEQNLVNEWHVFVATKLLGSSARPVLNMDVATLPSAPGLTLIDKSMTGDDFYLIFKPAACEGGN